MLAWVRQTSTYSACLRFFETTPEGEAKEETEEKGWADKEGNHDRRLSLEEVVRRFVDDGLHAGHPLRIGVNRAFNSVAYTVELSPNLDVLGRLKALAATEPGRRHTHLVHSRRLLTWLNETYLGEGGEADDGIDALSAYVAQYEAFEDVCGQLSRNACTLLRRILGWPAHDPAPPSQQVHRQGIPAWVLQALLDASFEEALWDDARALLVPQQGASPGPPLVHAGSWHERLRARQARWPTASLDSLEGAARRRLAETGNATPFCAATARLVHMAELNDRFDAALARTGARPIIEHAVAAVRTALQGLVRESPTLGASTRAAAAAKLERVAINVLLPDGAAGPNQPTPMDSSNSSSSSVSGKDFAGDFMTALAAHWTSRWRLEVQARLARNEALLALEHAPAANNTSAVAALHREHAERLREEYRQTMAHEVVNAWYDPTRNTITIPPGILGAPFYVAPAGQERGADALLPRIGAVVGHELGHALDVNGRFFDEWGRYVDCATGWWQAADERALSGRIACLAAEYAHPCGREDYGMHTMGEDMADQLGVRAALRAWRAAGQPAERNGVFFEAYAQLWCAHLSERQRCARVADDVHALPRHRVNKVLRQLAAFSRAYACPANTSMVSGARCIVY